MSDTDDFKAQADRLALVSRWADDLAHEIKNPLHAMVINLELVKRRADRGDPEAIVERAEIVESELHRVHDLIDSLLRLVRPWPDVATADVEQVFEALLPVFGARARIRRVSYAHTGVPGRVALAPGELAHLLVALVDRAIDETPEDGRIETDVSSEDDTAVLSLAAPAVRGDEPWDLPVVRALVERAGGSLETRTADRRRSVVVRIPWSGSP